MEQANRPRRTGAWVRDTVTGAVFYTATPERYCRADYYQFVTVPPHIMA